MPNADPEFVRTLAGIVSTGPVGTVRGVVARTCPDWPDLMEIAPELQFKHYTVAEAKLPADALMHIPEVSLSDVEICCDLDRHVFWAEHTRAERRRGPPREPLVRCARLGRGGPSRSVS